VSPGSQASPADNWAAVMAIERHHEQLARDLGELTESLLRSAEHRPAEAEHRRRVLLSYLQQELLPRAQAEEETLYPAAAMLPGMSPLVNGMLAEHRAIISCVGRLADARSAVRAAGAATAITELFATHLAKENELIAPALAASPEVPLAELVEHMRALLGPADEGVPGDLAERTSHGQPA
jgi:Hemerythrin HHE cation binding domain